MLTVLIFATCLCAIAGETVDLNRVVFIIHSQPNAHHASIAVATKRQLQGQLKAEGCTSPQVLLTHEDDPVSFHGAWTYFPVIATLYKDWIQKNEWFIFLEENTIVDVAGMKEALAAHRPEDVLFIGHSLVDKQNVVIHHYDSPGLRYPLPAAGIILSAGLVKQMGEKISELKKDRQKFPADFNIDPAYELAKAIKKMGESYDGKSEPPEVDTGAAVELIHEKRLCFEEQPGCLVWPDPERVVCAASDEEIKEIAAKTFFGVKTCKQFHEKRLPVLFDTWTTAVPNIKYFSEEADPAYGTSTLPGVKNTERGHCGKTMAIIKYFYEEMVVKKGFEWLVITDDDTMLGARKMMEHLNCYNPEDVVSLGQRYGFRVASGKYGYDYPTGGGGMVFSKAVAKLMLDRSDACACRSADQPDDMHLGACMASVGTPIVHSARFHQARPEDYHPDLLASHQPVSFHKFWSTDPRRWYDDWFREDDNELRELTQVLRGKKKDEL